MKKLLIALCVLVMVPSLSWALGPLPPSPEELASFVTWNLQDITFASGQTATGSFTVNQGLRTVTDWNIQVTGGSNPTLTNISFLPGGNCVAWCGNLGHILDLRTGLGPDDKFFELTLYLDAPLNEILHPSLSEIGVNSASSINYELLENPTTVKTLEGDSLNSAVTNPRVVTPEPPSLFLLTLGSAGIAILTRRSRTRKSSGS